MTTKKEVIKMREARIEVLNKDEMVMGTPTTGQFFVREYEDGEEVGGAFFETPEEADRHIEQYVRKVGKRSYIQYGDK